jgi:TetR/AcrR family transcriptional regulator
MPQNTFLNLPEERKREILNACFEEFAFNDYESASLSNIISRLGLAKGSFYRYFNNKLDLYKYLRQLVGGMVETKFHDHLNGSGSDFFRDWAEFFLSLGEIEKEYPMAIRFRFKAAFEQNAEVIRRQNLNNFEGRTKVMSSVIRKYQEKGLIRNDIDPNFLSHLLTFANFALSEYINKKYKVPPTSPVYAVDPEMLNQETQSLIDFLKGGVGQDNV